VSNSESESDDNEENLMFAHKVGNLQQQILKNRKELGSLEKVIQ
jgi:hypothetical protein